MTREIELSFTASDGSSVLVNRISRDGKQKNKPLTFTFDSPEAAMLAKHEPQRIGMKRLRFNTVRVVELQANGEKKVIEQYTCDHNPAYMLFLERLGAVASSKESKQYGKRVMRGAAASLVSMIFGGAVGYIAGTTALSSLADPFSSSKAAPTLEAHVEATEPISEPISDTQGFDFGSDNDDIDKAALSFKGATPPLAAADLAALFEDGIAARKLSWKLSGAEKKDACLKVIDRLTQYSTNTTLQDKNTERALKNTALCHEDIVQLSSRGEKMHHLISARKIYKQIAKHEGTNISQLTKQQAKESTTRLADQIRFSGQPAYHRGVTKYDTGSWEDAWLELSPFVTMMKMDGPIRNATFGDASVPEAVLYAAQARHKMSFDQEGHVRSAWMDEVRSITDDWLATYSSHALRPEMETLKESLTDIPAAQ